MNTKDFTDFCFELNEDCIRKQDSEKEIISDDNAFLADAYIKNMSISDAGDVLLFCSCNYFLMLIWRDNTDVCVHL